MTDAGGRGLARVSIRLTGENGETQTAMSNSFGYYRFGDLPVGRTHYFTVRSKRHTFGNGLQAVSLMEDRSGINFVAEN